MPAFGLAREMKEKCKRNARTASGQRRDPLHGQGQVVNLEDVRSRISSHRPDPAPERHLRCDRAAVLVPVIEAAQEPRILLTERSGNLDSHSGEVAFPGGKQDESDESLAFTALRETEEEIGLPRANVELVGELKPFISKHGLLVTPHVGIVKGAGPYEPNPDEIAAVFEVPVSFVLDEPSVRTDVISRHGETHEVPVFRYQGFEIWGLTAMILVEFIRVGYGREL